jgi:hypothetical protein
MATTVIGDERKLGELIIYISQKSANDRRFGATKLNKLLYFADFFAFGKFGKAITEVPYQHLKAGPAPTRLRPIRARLEKEKAIAIQEIPLLSGNVMHKTIALREPDLRSFSGPEIALVDSLINEHWDRDSDSISDASHNYVGWKMTKEGQSIPYGSIFLSDAPLSQAETKRGQQIAKKYGWTHV